MTPEYLPKDFAGKLWRLAEECGEVIKAASKVHRFGLEGDGHQCVECIGTPRDRLLSELDDLDHAISEIRSAIRSSKGE